MLDCRSRRNESLGSKGCYGYISFDTTHLYLVALRILWYHYTASDQVMALGLVGSLGSGLGRSALELGQSAPESGQSAGPLVGQSVAPLVDQSAGPLEGQSGPLVGPSVAPLVGQSAGQLEGQSAGPLVGPSVGQTEGQSVLVSAVDLFHCSQPAV